MAGGVGRAAVLPESPWPEPDHVATPDCQGRGEAQPSSAPKRQGVCVVAAGLRRQLPQVQPARVSLADGPTVPSSPGPRWPREAGPSSPAFPEPLCLCPASPLQFLPGRKPASRGRGAGRWGLELRKPLEREGKSYRACGTGRDPQTRL